MVKKVGLLFVIIILISFNCIYVSASEKSAAPELQLEYVDSWGWGSEYICARIPMTEDELDSINQMLVYYSFDGESYHPVIQPRVEEPWDLMVYGFGEIDGGVYINECMNPATTPFKQFLAGEVDSFMVKIHIIADTYDQYTTPAKLERNNTAIPLPEYCQTEISYPRDIIGMYRDENGLLQTFASQSVEVPQGTTKAQILKVLPKSYNMEIAVVEDSSNLLGKLTVPYATRWNIPDSPETLAIGKYTITAGNAVIPPADKQILKKGLQQYSFTAPSADIALHLIITVTKPDGDNQITVTPPSSDAEGTGEKDEGYGNGGNRGDVGNNQIEQVKHNDDADSNETDSPNMQSAQQKTLAEAQVGSAEVLETEDNEAYNQSVSQTDSDMSKMKEEVILNRGNNIPSRYLVLIFVISIAISAGIGAFIYWRKSSLKG